MGPDPIDLDVVVVAPSGFRGGAELVLRRALLSAQARGWGLRCLCPAGALAEDLTAAGITTVTIPPLSLPSGPRALGVLRFAVRTVRVARVLGRMSRGTDKIVVNGLLGLPAVALVRPRPPVVLLVHEVVSRADRLRLLRRLRGRVAVTITVSAAAAAALAKVGLEARVVPNGTPWPVLAAPPSPPSPPMFGCVGALTPGKGQHILVEALAMLERPDVVVELVGEALPRDARYVAALRSQVEASGLAARVRFSGHLSNPLDRVRGWTAAVLASVQPEGDGLSVLEAMSVGVPVVCSDHGGAPEALGEAGLLVAPGDAAALAEALARLITDEGLRRRCATAGPLRVAERYALDARIAELLAVVAEPGS